MCRIATLQVDVGVGGIAAYPLVGQPEAAADVARSAPVRTVPGPRGHVHEAPGVPGYLGPELGPARGGEKVPGEGERRTLGTEPDGEAVGDVDTTVDREAGVEVEIPFGPPDERGATVEEHVAPADVEADLVPQGGEGATAGDTNARGGPHVEAEIFDPVELVDARLDGVEGELDREHGEGEHGNSEATGFTRTCIGLVGQVVIHFRSINLT